ncbi:response regulator [Helicobacter bizzozeronii]|uniref:response regulator n=1 Tax=Helicobacter bizzozeronii TaxID=56877 RepID=UPI000CF08D97|nr:response regulator [Helicobacter bizzozeronii]
MNRTQSVLIIEDEVHLAQSIASALSSLGYKCQSASSIFHHFKEDYDVVLISAKVCVDRCEHFVRKNSRAITIMMASFVSEDGVNRPIKAGARDYILKPFKMDELIRKITYHKAYKEAMVRAGVYERYLDFVAQDLNVSYSCEDALPLVLHSHTQNTADLFALNYARVNGLDLEFFSLKTHSIQEVFRHEPSHLHAAYITHLEVLRHQDREKLLKMLPNHHAMVSFVGHDNLEFEGVVHYLEGEEPLIPSGLLSIQDYEKSAIQQFSPCYTDTELAKRLGISRKSLWEKRRRYNLPRKPNVVGEKIALE